MTPLIMFWLKILSPQDFIRYQKITNDYMIHQED